MARHTKIDRLLSLFAREGAARALLPMTHTRHQMMTRGANIRTTAQGAGAARNRWLVDVDFHSQ